MRRRVPAADQRKLHVWTQRTAMLSSSGTRYARSRGGMPCRVGDSTENTCSSSVDTSRSRSIPKAFLREEALVAVALGWMVICWAALAEGARVDFLKRQQKNGKPENPKWRTYEFRALLLDSPKPCSGPPHHASLRCFPPTPTTGPKVKHRPRPIDDGRLHAFYRKPSTVPAPFHPS